MKFVNSTKELIICAYLGALSFVIFFIFSYIFVGVIGIPFVGSIFGAFFFLIPLVIGLLIIRKIGAPTLMMIIIFVLSIPTTVLGPPGIIKLWQIIPCALMIELFLILFRWKKVGYFISLTLGMMSIVPFQIFVMSKLGLPAYQKMQTLILPISLIFGIEAILAVWVSFSIYERKIKKMKIIKQFQT